MISTWLGDTPLAVFHHQHFQRAPLASPVVVRDGSLLDGVRPRDAAEFLDLFQRGCSVVLRGCHAHDAELARLAGAFAAELEGDVAVHVFITPAGHHSFGWHYDCEDVFIVQTAGVKHYLLRQNTVNPRPRIDAMPRDMAYERETSGVVLESTLVAGDWIYVPRGWWHKARCLEHSLSISIGVLSPDAGGKRRL